MFLQLFCTVLYSFFYLTFSAEKPMNLQLIYISNETKTIIATNWTNSDKTCENGSTYLETYIYDFVTNQRYTAVKPPFILPYNNPIYSCNYAQVNASNVCINHATNLTTVSDNASSNNLVIVLPIGEPANLSSSLGGCITTSCSIILEFPDSYNQTCSPCSFIPHSTSQIRYETNLSCNNFIQDSSTSAFCNESTNVTNEYGKYRLICTWNFQSGNPIQITTDWSSPFIISYDMVNLTNSTAKPIPFPVLITIASVFALASATGFTVVMIRIFCPDRAGYLKIN